MIQHIRSPSAILIEQDAPIRLTRAIDWHLLEQLRTRQICAIHIPRYIDPKLAAEGFAKLKCALRPTRWRIGPGNSVPTDMGYALGYPRMQAMKSKRDGDRYLRETIRAHQAIADAFSPGESPMEQLAAQIARAWPAGAETLRFRGRPGLLGLLRLMTPELLFDGRARSTGVCHVDAGIGTHLLSANIYLEVPRKGGELRVWPLRLDTRLEKHPLYRLIRNEAYSPGVREGVSRLLPEPHIIRPRRGDLVIFDASRPHSVGGFEVGMRASLQTFIRFPRVGRGKLELSS